MIPIATRALITRAIAFVSTLTMSLAIVGSLPRLKERRQRYFANASLSGSVWRMQLFRLSGANINTSGVAQSPLLLAAGEGRLSAVSYLLDEGADIDSRVASGNTALTEAAFYGHAAVAKELLVRGANVNAVRASGTALDMSTSKNDSDLIEILNHYGAKHASELR